MSQSHRLLLVLIATVTLIAVFASHGVMAEGSMHDEGASECLATTADISPTKVCSPVVSTAASVALVATLPAISKPADDPRPAPTGHRARHGPSDLQVFRT